MADTVRYMMEEMIPELEDLVKQQYFSREEVKAIVKRRQDFEYVLKRKAALKEDFLRYIEYESKLEELRQHRRKALTADGPRKKGLSDYAIVRRIHFIFERAVRKFKSDLTLWTAWLEFCRASASHRRLGRVAGRALQVHPTQPGLWVYAAAWEFEHNANPAAARALMQQGLRMCRGSGRMWLDYLDMELMYVEKLVARRRILGLDVPAAEGEQQEQEQEQPQEQQPRRQQPARAGRKRRQPEAGGGEGQQREEEGEDGDGRQEDGEGPADDAERRAAAAEAPGAVLLAEGAEAAAEAAPADPQAAVRAVLLGEVARLVLRGVLKSAAAAAGGLGFRAQMLEVLRRYRSPGVAGLLREVLDGVRRDFPQDPDAADLLARAACDPASSSAAAADVAAATREYERLLGGGGAATAAAEPPAASPAAAGGRGARGGKRPRAAAAAAAAERQHEQAPAPALPAAAAARLYSLYAGFLSERLAALLGDEARVMDAAAATQQLFRVLLRAHEAGAAGVPLYEQWVDTARQLNQGKVALKAARLACAAHPSSTAAWRLRVGAEAAAQAHGKGGGGELLALITEALRQVPAGEAEPLWDQALELCDSAPQQLPALQALLVDAVTRASVRGPPSGGLGSAAAACLRATWRLEGAEAARALWRRLLLLPPAGGDMFREMAQLEAAEPPSSEQARHQQQQQQQQQQQRRLAAAALARVRAVYEAWADAYGRADPELWVELALLEQAQGRAGAGAVYWRAVKALDEPEEFVAAYRERVGAV